MNTNFSDRIKKLFNFGKRKFDHVIVLSNGIRLGNYDFRKIHDYMDKCGFPNGHELVSYMSDHDLDYITNHIDYIKNELGFGPEDYEINYDNQSITISSIPAIKGAPSDDVFTFEYR